MSSFGRSSRRDSASTGAEDAAALVAGWFADSTELHRVEARIRPPRVIGYSGWNSASVFPSGSLNHADLPMPGVVATWFTVFSVGKS